MSIRPFKVNKTTEALAYTNCIIFNPRDMDPRTRYIVVDNQFYFNVKTDQGTTPGEIGTSLFHRKYAQLSLNQEVQVKPFDPSNDPNAYLGTLNLEVAYARKGIESKDYLDSEEIGKVFTNNFSGQIFVVGQAILLDFKGTALITTVTSVENVDIDSLKAPGSNRAPLHSNKGIFTNTTTLQFSRSGDSSIKLKNAKGSSNSKAIIQPNFKFEDMGIGGLDAEFSNIFRRAFASRIFPPHIVEKLGIQHVKGILMYGPPGTGKTLMARQIGKMLNSIEPIIVNGPEILNKFVGQSEENVRKLFGPAEAEYKQRGDDSQLHIIIFDELDAICKQRGSKNDGTGVGDSVVNQLLSKMDGVDQLNNILIIGMTNRLDMIDEALLRPGRLEIHIEISLPDENGRFQILNVHTAKMKKNDILDADVDLKELASLTKNFSGAEIAGLIKSATSFSFNRHVKVGTLATVSTDYENMKVNRDDFMKSLDEVRASFGVSEAELKTCVANGIIRFNANVDRILSDGQLFVDQVRNSSRTPLVSVLLHGPSGSGKTALAATIAMASEFPFIKLISPEAMVGYSEASKMTHINKIFNDAYKSPLSVIVVDCIERILDWVPIGPRFSNSVLQTLLVLFKKPPPNDRKLLILATTTNKNVLEQMDFVDAFNTDLYVPNIVDLNSVSKVIEELQLFNQNDLNRSLSILRDGGIGDNLSVGVKKLLMISEMARQDVDKVDKFVSTLIDQGGSLAFRIYDVNNDGLIDKDDLHEILKLMVGSELEDSQITQLVKTTIIEADILDNDGCISFEEFVLCFEDSQIDDMLTIEI
ncbi:transport between ER and Golgi ATPase protein [Lobulomyces angularis]|nr:transport between ER and Golgi ATPase protein [Lobulomyces angularis]